MKKGKVSFLKCFLVGIILGIAINYGNSQTDIYKKNAIYLGYGSVVFASQYSLSYERIVHQENHFRTGIKLSYGVVSSDGLDLDTNEKEHKNYKGISGVVMFNAFEISLGVAHSDYTLARGPNPDPGVDYDKQYSGFNFYGSTGLRFVNDDFMLKVGIGNFEYLYLGAGVNF